MRRRLLGATPKKRCRRGISRIPRRQRATQTLRGHKSIATTARDTHIDSERLRTLVGNLRLHS